MCGIAGMLSPGGGVRAETVRAMRKTLAHRGPDDAGLWLDDGATVGLGHRRLSILDLSERGRQPMTDPLGRAVICYNGEVYNFAELRDDLRAAGATFRTDTDTEVLLQAYLAWGEAFVDRLEGMFALAIWDVAQRQLLLVRDRLGIKPLHLAVLDGGVVVFGSEIRAVLASGRVDRDLSPEAAWDFFSHGYVPAPATIYRQVQKLPPGHLLRASADGQVEIARWWSPRFEHLDDSPETAQRRLIELVDRSVAEYLVADVPTGAYLSGGLDSSIVTQRAAELFRRQRPPDGNGLSSAAALRLGGQTLHSFTIGFDVAEHSETDFARLAAERYGTEHCELIVSGGMARQHDETLVTMFDEPFAASSAIPMTFLAELARRKVTVALCGEGGDEAFGGYGWYRNWLKFRQPSFWATPAGKFVRNLLEPLIGRPRKRWRLPALDDVELYAQLMGAFAAEDKRRVFSPEMARHLGDRDPAGAFRLHWRDDLPPIARMQYVDLMTFLPDLNLTRADRTSMRVGLELRVPLLNHHLVEYSIGLPESVRNPAGAMKGLFKQTFANRLPDAIRQRRKKGFSAPVREWFDAGDLPELVRAVGHEQPERARAWLAPDLEDSCRRFRGSRAYKLWCFLQWLRRNP
jgi:asparagine synthase (glutamine-hydrolysing)